MADTANIIINGVTYEGVPSVILHDTGGNDVEFTLGAVGEDTLVEALHNRTTSVTDDTLTSIRSYGLAYLMYVRTAEQLPKRALLRPRPTIIPN